MLDMWKRWIQFHELSLKSEPEEAPAMNLSDVIPAWISRIEDGEAVKIINSETAAIRVVEVDLDLKHNALILLIHYSDLNVTDPVFSNLETGELRTEPKLDGEGVAVSCHVVLSMNHMPGNSQNYRMLVEEVPGLGRSRLKPFIRSELKAATSGLFTFKDADDGYKTKNYRPAAEVLGTPSQHLVEELNGGASIQAFELVKFKKKEGGIDEEGYYKEESQLLRLVPYKEGGASPLDVIAKIRDLAKKENYDDVKIRYKHPQGKQKTATMGSTMSDLQDALVVRDEMITSSEVLMQCEEKIVKSIASKMLALLEEG